MPISPDTTMSFAQTYIFASTVRNKLTKQASNPSSSLRVLVTQANMLDNVMDHLQEETEKRVTKNMSSTAEDDHKHVSFQLPEKDRQHGVSTNVTEYEVGSESDSNSDSDSYSEDDESDSDSDYYYSSDDEEETQVPSIQVAKAQSFKQLPCMNLAKYSIEEEEEKEKEKEEKKEEEMPELSRSVSLTDDENLSLSDDEDIDESNYTYATANGYPLYHNQNSNKEDSSAQHNLIITRSSHHYDGGHNSNPNTFAIENIF